MSGWEGASPVKRVEGLAKPGAGLGSALRAVAYGSQLGSGTTVRQFCLSLLAQGIALG
jgi:hypothetical protein